MKIHIPLFLLLSSTLFSYALDSKPTKEQFSMMSAIDMDSQSPTKQESLDDLKQTLQGQMIYYEYGEPCSSFSGGSLWRANQIAINKITYEHSHIIIEFSAGEKKIINTLRIDMKNHFVNYSNAIFESKQIY